jgi:outer membrane protein OmpA-like peptidoglycan-associated protein
MLFDFDAFNIKPAAEATLLKLAAHIRQKSPRQLSVEGHTDAIGGTVYNTQLSALRARSIACWLAKHNVMAAPRAGEQAQPVPARSVECCKTAGSDVGFQTRHPRMA